MGNWGNRIVLLAVTISLAFVASICAEDDRSVGLQEGWGPENLRAVQEKLRDNGLYFGEIDGAYSSELAAALGRYQIRNGLPITGQLDAETSKVLGAKPAVATTATDQTRSSETWRRLRMSEQQTRNNEGVTPSQAHVMSEQSSPASSDAKIHAET